MIIFNIFYFVHLAYYSYVWHDESLVLLHLSGYTPEQLINYLFDGQIKSTEQLWQFQGVNSVKGSVGISGIDNQLKPTDIHAVFPPDGSLGEHSNVLPHIILNRSTLPWERQSVSNNNDTAWLALLLFEETENPESKIITLETLKDINIYTAKFPNFSLESGQHEDDKVIIIDVQKQLLEKILPTKEDLTYLISKS